MRIQHTTFSWLREVNQLTLIVAEEGTFVHEILLLNETQLQIVVVEMNGVTVPEEEQENF